jgi:hypothetical protein
LSLGLSLSAAAAPPHALDGPALLRFSSQGAPAVQLVAEGRAAPLLLDPADAAPVRRAAQDLREDLQRVSGTRPELLALAAESTLPALDDVVVVGTLGRSAWIDDLAARGLIDAAALRGRWEGLLLQAVAQPWPGVRRALVIAGSDPRGAIFGLYTLSEQIGVSPWHWWADVPPHHHAELAVPLGTRHADAPVVRWRGLFLNDEAPALSGWVRQFHGGFTHSFYAKVFELLLRLRANTLWPAMWGSAFYADDPLNGATADAYGIVMGTSHHEPLLRAQSEWRRDAPPGGRGPWDYTRNAETLRRFWADGAARAARHESLVTIGMRGDGDEPMTEGTDVALLERIINDQRRLLAQATGRPADEVPQVLALYKEVQAYFEQGLQVPDDVLLLWSDDNWGHLRRVPTAQERQRRGGAGIYYHFDYVGGPRSYKWLNVTPLPQVWEQMHLAWQHGATRLWIANVGDLKPMEVPAEFFLRYAWNPAAWPAARLDEYLARWAAREFALDGEDAVEAAALVSGYTRLNGRRKPELLDADTYSLLHEHEAERVAADWADLVARAERLHAALPPQRRDAFFQLVLHPVLACANLQALYDAVGRNHLYARQGRHSAQLQAERARQLFAQDAEITRRYHEDTAGGKWRHLMSQAHIGYSGWNQPPRNLMPELAAPPPPMASQAAVLGVMAEGRADAAWAERGTARPVPTLALPPLDAHAPALLQTRWFEVFNRGRAALPYTLKTSAPWLTLSSRGGDGRSDERVQVGVRWAELPPGTHEALVILQAADGSRLQLLVNAVQPAALPTGAGHLEALGVLAIEAAHTTTRLAPAGREWLEVPGLGRTLSGMTPLPVTAEPLPPSPDGGLQLTYTVHLREAGTLTLHTVLSPTLNIHPGPGLRYAVALDDEPPQIVNVHSELGSPEQSATWARWVTEGVMVHRTQHLARRAGPHTLRFWVLDPGLVLQRLVLDRHGLLPSYLGPPESARAAAPPRTPRPER